MIPGELRVAEAEPLAANEKLETRTLPVSNTGDRPIQVGSHFHFYEVNSALEFDRDQTLGFRLNIAAGTAVRFEPGMAREVDLVARRGRTLAFIEVKARSSAASAAFALDHYRLRRVAAAAEALAPRFMRDSDDVRIDAIFIVPWRFPRHLADVWSG